jgi:F-type H+-transporting ATPase subunit epsilon
MSLFLEIVTPDSIAFAKEVKGVVLPTANGRIHILPNHIPIIDRVVPGYVKVSLQGEDDYFSINRGFVEVYGEKVSIITDGASKAKEEDEAAIEEAISKAQSALTEAKNSNIDQAKVDQLEATARFEMAKKIARSKSR